MVGAEKNRSGAKRLGEGDAHSPGGAGGWSSPEGPLTTFKWWRRRKGRAHRGRNGTESTTGPPRDDSARDTFDENTQDNKQLQSFACLGNDFILCYFSFSKDKIFSPLRFIESFLAARWDKNYSSQQEDNFEARRSQASPGSTLPTHVSIR